ncbi:LicD family-domain-containing protein [Scheffersomyces coipomensis]|uniref:LicD family-domain-containing protein n=1 Tax=Scheffersomyces coipomensis TaxID=1788519 RepID=UPI00315CA49F
MVHIRRSRGVLLVISVILLHIIIASLLKYNNHPYLAETTLNLLDIKKSLLKYNSLSSTSKANEDFNQKVSQIKLNITESLVTSLPDSYYDIDLPFKSIDIDNDNDQDQDQNQDQTDLSSQDNDVIKIDDNEPYLINHYDPRFTFGVLFNYLSNQLIKNEPIKELPHFHWGDYVDLSQLNQFIFNPKKLLCQKFDTSAKSTHYNNKHFLKKPEHYCFDDNDMSKFIDQNQDNVHVLNSLKLIQSSKFTTGFHIFRSPGRQKLISRSILAKSYLNDFMTLPLSLTLLLPNQDYLHLDINQNILTSKKKLTNTDHYKQVNLKSLNLKHELNQFMEISSSNIDKIENLHHPDPLPIHKNLTDDLFIDNSSAILDSMKLNAQSVSESASDKLYRQSLEMSLTTQSPMKYFDEANIVRNEKNYGIGGHYDWRFFHEIVNYSVLQDPVLHGLNRAWLKFTNRVGTKTWIAHGTLLSWYWDALNFPWDNDVDIQMPVQELHKLCKAYNQTVVVDFGNDMNNLRFGRYFLDCGTYISHRVRGNGANNIDARFIDVDTGAYVDITALALSNTEPPRRYNDYLPTDIFPYRRNVRQPMTDALSRNTHLKAYNCRNNHFSRLVELSPLRLTIFEGEFSYLPSNFELSLKNEYGEKSLMLQTFRGYTFLPRLRNWVKVESIIDFIKEFNIEKVQESAKTSKNDNSRFALIKDFLNADYFKLLNFNHGILKEYLQTANLTHFHEVEMMNLLNLNKGDNKKSTTDVKKDDQSQIENIEANPLKQSVEKYLRPDYYSFKHQQDNLKTSFAEKIEKLKIDNKNHKLSGIEQIKNDLKNLEFKLSLDQGSREIQEVKDLNVKQKQPFLAEETEAEKKVRINRIPQPNHALRPPAVVQMNQPRLNGIQPGQLNQKKKQEEAAAAADAKERNSNQIPTVRISTISPVRLTADDIKKLQLEQQTDQDSEAALKGRLNNQPVA